MKSKRSLRLLVTGILAAIGISCVEEFNGEIQIETFDSILVVDARLTDQVASQSIHLSRTFEFDSVPAPERNAQVTLVSNGGAAISFNEVIPGTYTTDSAIRLLVGETYQLQITTQDGINYASGFEQLPEAVEIGEVRAIRRTNNTGLDGIAIILDNASNSGQPEFFRYEYEETYKIVAPDYNPFEWGEIDYDINDGDGWEVMIRPRTEESRVCYGTNRSTDLILTSTESLDNGGIDDFEVRFLSRNNSLISHRYSILVKQYHHTLGANSFYETLQDFSSIETVFSAVQPGLLEGNISATNSGVSVLGYLELSSYSEKRVFFDYGDHFSGEPLPPYFMNCATGAPPLYPEGFHITPSPSGDGFIIDGVAGSPLIDGILAGLYAYHAENGDYEEWIRTEGLGGAAPFLVKPLGCGDCRVFGNSSVPEFWME